jgi:halocyanin-like protein
MTDRTRREALAGVGTVAAAALAGCAGAVLPGGDEGGEPEPTDRTGEERVTVAAGADAGFAFGPANLVVDAGTTVVWEWTGAGGAHNVVDKGGAFESDLTGEEGYTFEHAFGEPGVFEYVCTPHQTRGMEGRIVADTSSLPAIMPELENVRSQVAAMGGASGGGAGGNGSSGGGLVDSIKGALGLGGGGSDGPSDEEIEAAERLVQEYADELQAHLEEVGKWEQVRVAYQE